jgi:hypothetical protein
MQLDETTPAGRWFCERCQARYQAPGDCQRCPDEPLLDLHDEHTRLAISEMDDARRRRRHGLLGIISLACCSPTLVLVMLSTKLAVLAWVGATGVLTGILWKLFPTRDRLPEGLDSH